MCTVVCVCVSQLIKHNMKYQHAPFLNSFLQGFHLSVNDLKLKLKGRHEG